jgi:hypothetical protein
MFIMTGSSQIYNTHWENTPEQQHFNDKVAKRLAELLKEQQREILRLRAENDEAANAVQDVLAEVAEISLELEGQFDTNARLSLANALLRKERDLMAECLDAKQESQGKARRPSCACCLNLFVKNLQLQERLKMQQAEKDVIASDLVRYRSNRDSLLQDIIDTKNTA